MNPPAAEVPYGTLDLMVLKTLAALGPQHGYGIARRIEQVAAGSLALNQARFTLPCCGSSRRGGSTANRARAEQPPRPFLHDHENGQKQLAAEAQLWARTVTW